MALDLYHRVLHKLYEVTEGKSSKAVDFKSLVKQLGFPGHYSDIFKQLSGEGWIVETPKLDFVSISHWGVAEVKKTSPSEMGKTGSVSSFDLKGEADKALSSAKELSGLLESLVQNATKENLPPVEKKLSELQNVISQLKKNLP